MKCTNCEKDTSPLKQESTTEEVNDKKAHWLCGQCVTDLKKDNKIVV